MTKIWVLSDLHQEFTRDRTFGADPHTAFEPEAFAPSEFDVVVLAGDIDVPLTRSLQWAAERFAGVPTIYVPGNHDFYTLPDEQFTLVDQIEAGRALADKLGISLLSDNTVEIGNTRFVGSTLWTDFQYGPGNIRAKMREAAGRTGMNDYKRIKRWSGAAPSKRKRLRPEDTINLHQASRAFIEKELLQMYNGPTVVVTHHAPLPASLDPSSTEMNFAYANNLRSIFEAPGCPDIWIHGHIHKAQDYSFTSSRIVANPRGYRFVPDQRSNGFVPDLVVEANGHLIVG